MALLDSIINSVVNNPSPGKTNLVESAYKYAWSVNNYFKIHKFNLKYPSTLVKSKYSASVFTKDTPSAEILEALDLAVRNVSLTPLETAPIDIWTGNTWQYTNGRAQMGQATIEFVDFSNGKLYKELTGILNINANEYPKNQEWSIQILQHTNVYHNMQSLDVVMSPNETESNLMYLHSDHAMLDSISELIYDKSSQDFMTFNITFKYYKRT